VTGLPFPRAIILKTRGCGFFWLLLHHDPAHARLWHSLRLCFLSRCSSTQWHFTERTHCSSYSYSYSYFWGDTTATHVPRWWTNCDARHERAGLYWMPTLLECNTGFSLGGGTLRSGIPNHTPCLQGGVSCRLQRLNRLCCLKYFAWILKHLP